MPDAFGQEMSAAEYRRWLWEQMSELDWQHWIEREAAEQGWLVYHTYDSRKSAAGFPDLVLAHQDRGVVFLECKREPTKKSKNAPRPEQVTWLATLTAAGARAYLVRPTDTDAVAELLAGGDPGHIGPRYRLTPG